MSVAQNLSGPENYHQVKQKNNYVDFHTNAHLSSLTVFHFDSVNVVQKEQNRKPPQGED